MSFKTTAFLLVLLVAMGSYVYNYVLNKPKPPSTPRPFVYQYEMTDIVSMELRHEGKTTDVYLDQEKDEWRFVDPAVGEVDAGRLNGIRLLLSGPGANRLLFSETPTPAQLRDYGFNNPTVVANIALKDGRRHQVILGDQTPDGRNYYTKNSDKDEIYLVDYTWGNELKRFVNEPPVQKETPAAT
jgi:uncharacterized protein DUF4340